MGILDFISEITSAFSVTPVDADAPQADQTSGSDESEEKDVNSKEENSEDGGEEGDEEQEQEEEEEEEPEDIKPKLEEDCARSKQCAPVKHHFDECAERVTRKMEENDGKSDEDCVEEFFHLAHCASNCAAPKLFKQLK